MPSFRSPDLQAKTLVRSKLSLGVARYGNRNDGRIHSVGTARSHQSALKGFARWLVENGMTEGLHKATREQAEAYLAHRCETVGQKTVDLDVQAIRLALGIDLPRVRSIAKRPRELASEPRAYTRDQLDLVMEMQSKQGSFSSELVYATGVRAHELLTICMVSERAPSRHREWHPDRFLPRIGSRYTVVGKGGLIREVLVPVCLETELNLRRFPSPVPVRDRRVQYTLRYDLLGGNSWSSDFTKASKRALGWSSGGHGLRHAYAQMRIEELQRLGYLYEEAQTIVSQELGHFRPRITETYLR